jgi:hypothetical protein
MKRLIFATILLFSVTTAHAESFLATDSWVGGIFQDTYTCHAATAAYLITGMGWATDQYSVYAEMYQHYGNVTGSATVDANWWFSQHYPDIDTNTLWEYEYGLPNMIDSIVEWTLAGRESWMAYSQASGMSHMTAVAGYETDSQGNVIDLLTISSYQTPDNQTLNQFWLIQNDDGSWAWKYLPETVIICAGGSLMPMEDYVALYGSPVPEPATMLLLASGLAGLVGMRKRLRKS